MEELKSSVRSYKVNEHYKQSLSGPVEYYRISVNSQYREAGSTISDAVFNVAHVFPNQRAALANGEWHAFLENFEGKLDTQLAKTNIKLCLPDLVKSSHDYVMTSQGVCQTNDAIGHIPIKVQFKSPGSQAYDVPEILPDGTREEYDVPGHPVDALAAVPIAVSKVINQNSVGVRINPVTLFSGQLRILLRDEAHSAIPAGTGGGELNSATDGWRATLLFVHKPE